MTTTDDKKKGHLGISRWQVSNRGNVAHLRVGRAPKTICGEVITNTGKPVSANAVNPPCVRCKAVLRGVKKDAAEKEQTNDGQV